MEIKKNFIQKSQNRSLLKWWFLLSYLILSELSPAICGDIYFWTDSNGTRHYSNVRHPSTATDMQSYTEKESSQRFDYSDTGSSKNDIINNIINEAEQKKSVDSKSVDSKTVEKDKSDVNAAISASYNNTDISNILFKVLKVYDGDTVKVEGAGLSIMIRLIGIDAPESGRRNNKKKSSERWINEGQPFGQDAKKALARMVEGKNIRIKNYGTDRYNRLLSEIFTPEGTLVNLEMIRLGMAEVYKGTLEKGFDSSKYNKAESEAKTRRQGIWSLGANYQSPKKWRKQN